MLLNSTAFWLACLLLVRQVAGLEFDMVYQTKCIMEDINEGVLVLGEYAAERKSNAEAIPLSVKVITPPCACTFACDPV
jgi:hypothetical protein